MASDVALQSSISYATVCAMKCQELFYSRYWAAMKVDETHVLNAILTISSTRYSTLDTSARVADPANISLLLRHVSPFRTMN